MDGSKAEGVGELKQYCRYCANAIDYNGECEDFICEISNGFFRASKAKRENKCKDYVHNGLDIFSNSPDGSFREYKPREAYKPRSVQIKESGQVDMFGGNL